jgi:uncharacterized protein YbjT (DUF2867 family)
MGDIMRILVIGATGGTGRAVCDILLERGHSVTAVARHTGTLPAHPALTAVDGDATDADFLGSVAPGHDAVVVTLGISESALRVRLRGASGTAPDVRSRGTEAVVAAARAAGVRRIIVQTSFGVGSTRSLLGLVDRMMFALLLKPQIFDTEVQEGVVRGSGLDWTLVQPVYLTQDDSAEHFTSDDGRVRGRKVSRRAVARVHADLVEQSSLPGRTVTVSG